MKGNSPDQFDSVANVKVRRGERGKNAADFCSSVTWMSGLLYADIEETEE